MWRVHCREYTGEINLGGVDYRGTLGGLHWEDHTAGSTLGYLHWGEYTGGITMQGVYWGDYTSGSTLWGVH